MDDVCYYTIRSLITLLSIQLLFNIKKHLYNILNLEKHLKNFLLRLFISDFIEVIFYFAVSLTIIVIILFLFVLLIIFVIFLIIIYNYFIYDN